MNAQNSLDIIVYAPALMGKDRRTIDSVQGMEKALPGLRLEWRLSEGGRPLALPQRDAWLIESIEDGGFPIVCNGDENYPVTVMGRERSGFFSPAGQAQFEVHAELPLDAAVSAAAADVLEAVAEGARAFWGRATPDGAAVDIAYQTAPTRGGPPSPRRGLPALKLFEHIRSPEIPYYLGWLNYWSDASARAIGFPDPARDTEWLSRARRTATGGWIVQLTEAPLDLDDPAHLAALKRAYERFPEIGGRGVP
ncbi:hypothetical protein D7X99_00605 [Corallococcus sp. AB032C]|uniref:DUF5953 family protein n=1 Tax=Corallococcus TaxID=83461 RepID=UPI000EBD0AB4|nr:MULTISPECIES: DUF5953 family protein [Corallococcus]NPC46792.1 hypothetical protein [Corallococcus exiguus]NRD51537.1 hypothetical protein [Corallococcus exiguus]RKH87372.1 hypothetical protein D7X99_00605 [Corallococcus sp. AB032C]